MCGHFIMISSTWTSLWSFQFMTSIIILCWLQNALLPGPLSSCWTLWKDHRMDFVHQLWAWLNCLLNCMAWRSTKFISKYQINQQEIAVQTSLPTSNRWFSIDVDAKLRDVVFDKVDGDEMRLKLQQIITQETRTYVQPHRDEKVDLLVTSESNSNLSSDFRKSSRTTKGKAPEVCTPPS